MSGHAPRGQARLRTVCVADRRRLPGTGDERPCEHGLPAAHRTRDLRSSARRRGAGPRCSRRPRRAAQAPRASRRPPAPRRAACPGCRLRRRHRRAPPGRERSTRARADHPRPRRKPKRRAALQTRRPRRSTPGERAPVQGLPKVVAILARERGVAQSGSAPGWGPGGRRFKSSRPDQESQPRGVRALSALRLVGDQPSRSLSATERRIVCLARGPAEIRRLTARRNTSRRHTSPEMRQTCATISAPLRGRGCLTVPVAGSRSPTLAGSSCRQAAQDRRRRLLRPSHSTQASI